MGLLRQICTAGLRLTLASSLGCEHTVTEPIRIDGGELDLVLTDVPDVLGIWVGSPVGTSDYSVIFIDFFAGATYSSLGV